MLQRDDAPTEHEGLGEMEQEGDAERIGARATRRMKFRLYAPEAQRVSVAGDFNGWDKSVHQLSRAESGLWSITIELVPGRHEYTFYVDGEWRVDPDAVAYTANPHGKVNCVIEVY